MLRGELRSGGGGGGGLRGINEYLVVVGLILNFKISSNQSPNAVNGCQVRSLTRSKNCGTYLISC